MAGYGWDSYDPRTGGRQTIHDAGNGIDITTEFVKFVDHGENGGSWGARIRGTPREDSSPDMRTTVVFTVGVEGIGSLDVADAEGENSELGFDGEVKIAGKTAELGDFTVAVTKGKGDHPAHSHPSGQTDPLDRTRVHSLQLPEAAIWQAKNVMFTSMKEIIDGYIEKYTQEKMPPPFQTYSIKNDPGSGNLHFIQKTFEGAFEFDVMFSNGAAQKPLGSKDISEKIQLVDQSIAQRYAEVHMPKAPFTKPQYLEFSKGMFSNLIGGIGYFHGDQIIDRSYQPEYEEENEGFWRESAEARGRNLQEAEGPYELFTSIPSRPFFPRGFLWDEGFHLIPIVDWDVELTLQIIKSWFNTMDDKGWIAREQILGPEARSKVPAEFQVQYPHYANPPTLFFVLGDLLDKFESSASSGEQTPIASQAYVKSSTTIREYLQELYPLLKRHYQWFRDTQYGDIKSYDREAFSSKEAYRWRGSTQTHLLTSGLDDYPRPQPPHPGELHVDLISWMGLMTGTMKRIAGSLDIPEDEAEYAKIEHAILRNIDDLHWDEKEKTYCDATIDDYEENAHVCHKGYISIFPFMTGLLSRDLEKENKKLKAVMDLISDPAELWSNHGIRSLSQKDEFYNTGENYWRSPIWMNMNYLIVKELYVSLSSYLVSEYIVLTTALRMLQRHQDLTRSKLVRFTPS